MEEYKYTLAQGDTLVSPARKDKSGKVIAPERTYTITEVLGQGGFGITYKAEARVRTRVGNIEQKVLMEFAIKEFFMKDSCERDAEGRMRYSNPVRESVEDGLHSFISEAQRLNAICKLNHNIVDVNEVFEANGTAYFVMEYLDGGDLRQLVSQNRGKGLSEERALALILPIAEAMQAVHKEKILHLDIKPDNIVLRRGDDGSSEPVLIDFGLSVHFNKQGKVTSTKKMGGFSMGYSPQEQYAPLDTFAPWMDVYALAATLLYLLTGKDPANAFDVSDDYVKKTIPATVSEGTRRALLHALKQQKHDRTQTMEDFLKEMKNQPVPPQPVRKHLQEGFIVRGGRQDYCITAFCGEKKGFELYKAVIYQGKEKAADSHATLTATYTLRRFGVVMSLDGTATIAQPAHAEDVERVCKKVVKQWPLKHEPTAPGQCLNYELFTSDQKQLAFLVVRDKWKPASKPLPIPWPLIKRWGIIGGTGIIAAGIVALAITQCPGGKTATPTVKDSDSVTVLPTDSTVKDSVVPTAPTQAVIPTEAASTQKEAASTQKEAIATQKKAEEQKKKAEENKKAEDTRAAKKQEASKPTTSTATQTTKPTKTDGAIAAEYAKEGNYKMAAYYVRKAKSSGSGRAEAIRTNELLDKLGVYDNNENGGKVKFE